MVGSQRVRSLLFVNLLVLGQIEQNELVEAKSLHVVVEEHVAAEREECKVVVVVFQQGDGVETQFL